MPHVRVTQTRTDHVRCPYCLGDLADPIPPVRCSGCEARYHADCADEAGACATLGCRRPLRVRRSLRRRARRSPPLRVEGTRPPLHFPGVRCGGCGEEIPTAERSAGCVRCEDPYHRACADTYVRCQDRGCGGRLEPDLRSSARPRPTRPRSPTPAADLLLLWGFGAVACLFSILVCGVMLAEAHGTTGEIAAGPLKVLLVSAVALVVCLLCAGASGPSQR